MFAIKSLHEPTEASEETNVEVRAGHALRKLNIYCPVNDWQISMWLAGKKKLITVCIFWEASRIKYKLSCSINPIVTCYIAPGGTVTLAMVTAEMDAGALKATHSPSPERAVTLKVEHKHLSRALSRSPASFANFLVACESPEPFPMCTCAAS